MTISLPCLCNWLRSIDNLGMEFGFFWGEFALSVLRRRLWNSIFMQQVLHFMLIKIVRVRIKFHAHTFCMRAMRSQRPKSKSKSESEFRIQSSKEKKHRNAPNAWQLNERRGQSLKCLPQHDVPEDLSLSPWLSLWKQRPLLGDDGVCPRSKTHNVYFTIQLKVIQLTNYLRLECQAKARKKIRKRSDNATLGKRLQLQLQQQQQRQQLQTAVTGILHTYCDCCCCTAATVAVAVAVATVAACKVKAACGHSSVSVLIICKKQCDRFGETHWSLNAL